MPLEMGPKGRIVYFFSLLLIPQFICQYEDKFKIRIGALFETLDKEKISLINSTLENAVKIVNNLHYLPNHEIDIFYDIIEPDHPFLALECTCNLLSEGAIAILGPPSEENSNAIQSLCDDKDVPFIETRWDANQKKNQPSVNLFPYPTALAGVYVELVRKKEWKSFTILYENKEGLFRINELLRMYNGSENTIVIRQLDNDGSGDFKPTLKEVLKSDQTNFIIDCSTEKIFDVLTQAQQVGLITSKYQFIVINLDFQTINLEPFQFAESNITGVNNKNIFERKNVLTASFQVRLIDPKHLVVQSINKEIFNEDVIPTDLALIIDAVAMFSKALSEIVDMNTVQFEPIDCESEDNLNFGLNSITFMKSLTYNGLTGTVRFDNSGFRSDFSLGIVELTENGLESIGTWNSTYGLKTERKMKEVEPVDDLSLKNKTFVVVTALTAPYAMLKKSETNLSGNNQYEGFGIDLINELAKIEGFSYIFKVRKDKNNGKKLSNGTWDGMMGDIMYGRADLAIVDLTITSQRLEAVDFTSPFMTLGVSILYQKPRKAPPGFFSFAAPFGNDVWMTLGGAYFCVSIAFFIMGRLSPSEWTNPFPCIEEPKYLLNQFSLRNSFWFTIGSLMQQGSEIAPVAISTRMVAGVWWFFTLIMVSSYTANLAAFLTADSPLTEFSSAKELAENGPSLGIKYGAKSGGATFQFFNETDDANYKKIGEYMLKHPEDMVDDNLIGVVRAENEKYAFFMESTSIEYEIQRHCNLTQIGSKLDEKGYGIAMKKNSTYRHTLITAVLQLQESGKITDLKRKWWEEIGASQCAGDDASAEAPPLDLKNVSGIFWVTIGGTLIAFIMVFVEMIMYILRISVKYNVPFGEELRAEVKHCFAFDSSTKPVRQKLTRSSEESDKKINKENDNDRINNQFGFTTSPDITNNFE